jgi:hypothetical protein
MPFTTHFNPILPLRRNTFHLSQQLRQDSIQVSLRQRAPLLFPPQINHFTTKMICYKVFIYSSIQIGQEGFPEGKGLQGQGI